MTEGHMQRKRVLIIEDDEQIAKALDIRLRCKYEVLRAPDAIHGLHEAVSKNPDLIIMDIMMPAGNGITLTERIREVTERNIPTVFITASKLPGLRETAKKMGAFGYLEKPFPPEELLVTVHEALRGQINAVETV